MFSLVDLGLNAIILHVETVEVVGMFLVKHDNQLWMVTKEIPIRPLYRKTYRTDFEPEGREIYCKLPKIHSQNADHIVQTMTGM